MSVRKLKEAEKATVKTIDATVKNKWSWKWCEEEIACNFPKVGEVKYKLKDCIDKIDVPGHAFCNWCQDKLNYGNNGKNHLLRHCKLDKHLTHVKTRAFNYTLGGTFSGPSSANTSSKTSESDSVPKPKNLFSIFNGLKTKKDKPPPTESELEKKDLKPLIPLKDRTANIEAMILAFMSEHSCPLLMSGPLETLIKECARDPQALSGVSLSKTSSSYKLKYGLGKTITNEIIVCMKTRPFSLTADESTTIHGKRVLTILVSYLSDVGKQTVQHLASVELSKVDAQTISDAIISVIEDNSIPWRNLVSTLFDSCSVMRGNKSGVETRLRQKAPHLLDINGDSCHHIHNVVKEFCQPFDKWLEKLFTDLHFDLKYCHQYKSLMSELCRLGGVRFTVPQRFISHRWLSAFDRSMDTARLLDPYLLFYFSFVPLHEEGLYRPVFEEILKNLPSMQARQRARTIVITLKGRASSMTKEGKERKARIIEKLFKHQTKTICLLHIYMSILQQFKDYVLKFQRKDCLVHRIHPEQEQLTRKYLACFMKRMKFMDLPAGNLPSLSLSDCNFLEDTDIFVGGVAKQVLDGEDDLKTAIYKLVKTAYKASAKKLLEKLPLNNTFLQSVTALDPSGDHDPAKLESIVAAMEFIFKEEEKDIVEQEIRGFSVDKELPPCSQCQDAISWWEVVGLSYPSLRKIAVAALSCFHGPMVESSFNHMKDVIDCKAGSMDITTFSACQTVKYHLKSSRQTAVSYFTRQEIPHSPVNPELVKNMSSSAFVYKKQLLSSSSKTSVTSEKLQTSAAARRIREKALRKCNQRHHTGLKRKEEKLLPGLSKKTGLKRKAEKPLPSVSKKKKP